MPHDDFVGAEGPRDGAVVDGANSRASTGDHSPSTASAGAQATDVSLDATTRAALAATSTATLTTQLLNRGFRNCFIAAMMPMRPDLRMVGTAVTLRYVPAREDLDMNVDYDNSTNLQRVAVEAIEPGQVLVIDARESLAAASFGHIIATRILRRGAAGLVTDGALRDTPAFRSTDLPVYCRGVHATTSALAHHPVDMNVPIGCGGVLVMPGDVVVGDAEGVVVIPAAVAREVGRDGRRQEAMEELILRRIDAGESILGVYPPDARLRISLEDELQREVD